MKIRQTYLNSNIILKFLRPASMSNINEGNIFCVFKSCRKNNSNKNNGKIKQVLKKNGYQKNIISKIFKRISNNLSLISFTRSQK